jgi:hypothetical protein
MWDTGFVEIVLVSGCRGGVLVALPELCRLGLASSVVVTMRAVSDRFQRRGPSGWAKVTKFPRAFAVASAGKVVDVACLLTSILPPTASGVDPSLTGWQGE